MSRSQTLPTQHTALPGRSERWFELSERHLVLDAPLESNDVPGGFEVAIFGLGCFWGAEELFWQVPGVWSTSVGYAGGITPHPSYKEVCSGMTGHTEAVRIVFDPARVSFAALVAQFFEIHDPTHGMRQGNDVGTQYRSAIYYTNPEQELIARKAVALYGAQLLAHNITEPITTEIAPAPTYYYAEDYHQQYLVKVPHGYRCHANTGVRFPTD